MVSTTAMRDRLSTRPPMRVPGSSRTRRPPWTTIRLYLPGWASTRVADATRPHRDRTTRSGSATRNAGERNTGAGAGAGSSGSGATGAVGVAGADAGAGGPVPNRFTPTAVNVYATPGARPVITHDPPAPGAVHWPPPGDAVTT